MGTEAYGEGSAAAGERDAEGEEGGMSGAGGISLWRMLWFWVWYYGMEMRLGERG